jgi:hypothetical protein
MFMARTSTPRKPRTKQQVIIKKSKAPDAFVFKKTDSLAPSHELISAFLNEVLSSPSSFGSPSCYPSGTAILKLPKDAQFNALLAHLERILWIVKNEGGKLDKAITDGHMHSTRCHTWKRALAATFKTLAARKLNASPNDVYEYLRRVAGVLSHSQSTMDFSETPIPNAIPMLLALLEKHPGKRSREITAHLKVVIEYLDGRAEMGNNAQSLRRLRALSTTSSPKSTVVGLKGNDAWIRAANEDLKVMDAILRTKWAALLDHANVGRKGKPDSKWMKLAGENVNAISAENAKKHILRWFEHVGRGAKDRIAEAESDWLKGLAWYCMLLDDPQSCRALGTLAENCFRRLEQGGLLSSRTGKAALIALKDMSGMEPVAQLSRLKQRVKSPWALEEIGKALDVARARHTGVTPEELEELAVPTFDLDKQGTLTHQVDDHSVSIRVVGTFQTHVVHLDPLGKELKSLPAALKKKHSETLRQLKTANSDIRKMLVAQRDRIERLLASKRSWPIKVWRERYVEHPLLANISRRLIWVFDVGTKKRAAMWIDKSLVGHDGAQTALPESGTVTLWHPQGVNQEEVLAWRNYLENFTITQPFKQAHREIYILTQAELQTRTYSNRFAAHILRQGQFTALTQQRGWSYQMLGNWDTGGGSHATRSLAEWNLRVEFWINQINAEQDGYLDRFVSTDQVRFYRGNDAEPLPLQEVPPLTFSEAMRDVDLFVGVCSIGNDPQWRDAGGDDHRRYWHDFSYGPLSESGNVRADVLKRLIPRLKIAGKCRIDGRFLQVEGKLRKYKIHIGSTNILMQPNDQYLCIVPERMKNADVLYLPFEGDTTLSVLISKALMLANDDQITDESILRQIKS